MNKANNNPKEIDELDSPEMAEFIRKRITSLLMDSNISESKASMEMGFGRRYLNSITSGACLPTMGNFFRICNYFGITPEAFFDSAPPHIFPKNLHNVLNSIRDWDSESVELLLQVINKINQAKQ